MSKQNRRTCADRQPRRLHQIPTLPHLLPRPSPHFNVWDGGKICTGSVALPNALSADALTEYEAAFFRSHFTHPNRTAAVKYAGGMKALWRDQLAGASPEAMTKALKPAKETLEAAIQRITTSA